jgi:hypothetical protein
MLMDQITIVQQGGDPMNTFRDVEKNKYIDLALENYGDLSEYRKGSVYYMNVGNLSPVLEELDALMTRGAEAARAKQQ